MIGRLALVAGLAIALGPGCKRRASRERTGDDDAARAAAARAVADAAVASAPWVAPVAVIDAVEVELHGAAEGAIASRELGRRLARCLIEHGDDVVALDRQVDPARVGRHARLTVAIEAEAAADAAAAPHAVVAYAATLVWTDDATLPVPSAKLVGEASILGDRADTAVLAVVEKLLPEVCRILGAQVERLTGDDLAAGLAAPDPDEVTWTLAVIAARRPPALHDAIVALLDRPGPVGDAAITTLVALRDRRAVTALTDRVDLADRARLTTVIEAAIALGGPDAEDFLQVLGDHADPDVARHAREGLVRMRRAAGDDAPPP